MRLVGKHRDAVVVKMHLGDIRCTRLIRVIAFSSNFIFIVYLTIRCRPSALTAADEGCSLTEQSYNCTSRSVRSFFYSDCIVSVDDAAPQRNILPYIVTLIDFSERTRSFMAFVNSIIATHVTSVLKAVSITILSSYCSRYR